MLARSVRAVLAVVTTTSQPFTKVLSQAIDLKRWRYCDALRRLIALPAEVPPSTGKTVPVT